MAARPREVRGAPGRLGQERRPSAGLRQWYGHDPDKFHQFQRRYRDELDHSPGREALEDLRALAARGPLTLLTATRDMQHSQAVVLAELLDSR